jgi:secondary thiamine-phosphate synthase enzyme
MFQQRLTIRVSRRGLHDITRQVADVVAASGTESGLCNVFVQHTSASLIISENADPTARHDLEAYLDRLVPENAPYYRHTLEGPDDMPSHIKSVLTSPSLCVPITQRLLNLGTWQGIYLWEHRDDTPTRNILVSVL